MSRKSLREGEAGIDAYQVIYDEQCEVCQAGVSWLKVLDHGKQIVTHPIDPDTLKRIHPDLELEACLRELHVVTPDGQIVVGADAVILLARLFPETRLIGTITGAPGMRTISRMLYRLVALNRYALSKCRGGACRVVRMDAVVRRSGLAAFWSCYSVGMLIRLPLSITTALRDAADRLRRYVFTFRKRIDLLDGRLRLLSAIIRGSRSQPHGRDRRTREHRRKRRSDHRIQHAELATDGRR